MARKTTNRGWASSAASRSSARPGSSAPSRPPRGGPASSRRCRCWPRRPPRRPGPCSRPVHRRPHREGRHGAVPGAARGQLRRGRRLHRRGVAARRGARGAAVVFVGMAGKLTKLGAGVLMTHYTRSKVDCSLLGDITRRSAVRRPGGAVGAANTARHAYELWDAAGCCLSQASNCAVASPRSWSASPPPNAAARSAPRSSWSTSAARKWWPGRDHGHRLRRHALSEQARAALASATLVVGAQRISTRSGSPATAARYDARRVWTSWSTRCRRTTDVCVMRQRRPGFLRHRAAAA